MRYVAIARAAAAAAATTTATRRIMGPILLVLLSGVTVVSAADLNRTMLFPSDARVVVTNQAMGARCAVAADFDGDGRQDLVSASSNDNAVSWYRNEGLDLEGRPVFSIKKQITWSSLGSRIVTVADIDGDGHIDVVGSSYYDSSLRWYQNNGKGEFTSHLISTGVNEGQGVAVADLDNDGDADIITASSGDNTIAVFKNIDHGQFCQVKEIVDDNAMGARTVIASDLNGDGWIDLASASKDDDTIAWYPNDGTGHFPEKIIISTGNESLGAYSLVAADIDDDGRNDLIVASNANDHVSLWRNNGDGTFSKTLIYDRADFVLSVTAVDFDRDGDLDVASASFFDGYINWYENVDGKGYEWKKHTVYVGIQGHYVSFGDMDGDGDDDLIGVTHAENAVTVFLAQTECDFEVGENSYNQTHQKRECCHLGTGWNGTSCEPCSAGTYGDGSGINARCLTCPTSECTIPGRLVVPSTCSGYTECLDIKASLAQCSCPVDTMKDPVTDACMECPEGQVRPDNNLRLQRGMETIGNYSAWELQQGICHIKETTDYTLYIVAGAVVALILLLGAASVWRRKQAQAKADALWIIDESELTFDDPVQVLGKGSFGEVTKGYYRGTPVAVKRSFSDVKGSLTRKLSSSIGFSRQESLENFDIKMLVPDGNNSNNSAVLSNMRAHENFLEEMRSLSKLRHPCITTVMGACMNHANHPLLVMEYMETGSLRDLLSNQTFPLDAEQTLPLIRDIMQGLRFIHSSNPSIVHGDLKSSNVLVDGNFRAKIADFGFAPRKNRVATGAPFWMAPELLAGGTITTASDVYSFGVLLWEVMTHKLPYEGLDLTFTEILERVRDGKLRPDCDQKGLDEELADCMRDCWAQEADKRPTLEDLEMKLIPLCGQNLFTVMQERSKFAKRQSSLLQDVFPKHIAKALLAGKKVEPEHHSCCSIYFSDIVGFTTISSFLTAEEVSDMLDRLYVAFDELAGKHGVFKLETIGDAWVGACNLNNSQENDHAARISRFSVDAMRAAKRTAIHPEKPEMGNVKIRVGFHSGPVVSSVVGTKNPRYCLFGDTMNLASRMESTAEELRIQCSEVAADLAREQDSSLTFVPKGKIKVKGVKLPMAVFWLEDGMGVENAIVEEADETEATAHSFKAKKRFSEYTPFIAMELASLQSSEEASEEEAMDSIMEESDEEEAMGRSFKAKKRVSDSTPLMATSPQSSVSDEPVSKQQFAEDSTEKTFVSEGSTSTHRNRRYFL